jgi:hypothetical protein
VSAVAVAAIAAQSMKLLRCPGYLYYLYLQSLFTSFGVKRL